MMYKDKDKQREANKQASQRRRDKGMTKGMTNQGVTVSGSGTRVIPKPGDVVEFSKSRFKPLCETKPKRGKDIKCFEDLPIKCLTDLPEDIQASINRIAENSASRVFPQDAAIKYQHLFPDSYEPNHPDVRDETNTRPISVVTGKPDDEHSVSAGGVACGCEARKRKGVALQNA